MHSASGLQPVVQIIPVRPHHDGAEQRVRVAGHELRRECSTRWAFWLSGCWSNGVAKVLSTTTTAVSDTAAVRAGRSATSIVGLVGDSIHSRSASSAAEITAAVSETSTRRTVQLRKRGPLVDQGGDSEVAVRRQDDGRIRRQELDDRVRCGHSGAKSQRSTPSSPPIARSRACQVGLA